MTQRIVFAAQNGNAGLALFITDADGSGVSLLSATPPTETGGAYLPGAGIGHRAVFPALHPTLGNELWVTDGTGAGTVLLRDINQTAEGQGSQPDRFAVAGGFAYVAASDGVGGDALWRTDGTAAGTTLVSAIRPGPFSADITNLMAFGSRVVFTANDGTSGAELWISDGTASGTRMIADIEPGAEGSFPLAEAEGILGNRLFFSAQTAAAGRELWVTDGTSGGTRMVRELVPGGGDFGGANPSFFQVLNGRMFFSAGNLTEGMELWTTDGTAEGTALIKDTDSGVGASGFPQFLTALGNRIVFSATSAATGREVWVTDGTGAGTVLLRDINPGGADGIGTGPAGRFIAIGDSGKAVFVATTAAAGAELWVTDGTAAGTRILSDIAGGVVGSAPSQLTAAGGKVWFEAADASGQREVWVTDGTATGTFRAGDLGAAGVSGGFAPVAILTLPDTPPGPTGGPDTLTGTQGRDNIDALGGDDIVRGQGERDRLFGGAGDDTLDGGGGNDDLRGESGRDRLSGGSGADDIAGGTQADRIDGGQGNDQLQGDAAADRFIFGRRFGQDVIEDFRDGRDIIDLSALDIDFADLRIRAVNGADDTLVIVTARQTILLEDFDRAALRQGMFDLT